MKKLALAFAGSALIVGFVVSGLSAHEIRGPMMQQSPLTERVFDPSWMGAGTMMGLGMMMGGGMMGHGMMGPGMMIVMMDTNGDGALSLDEFQAIHARMFKYLDANHDGQLTTDELNAFRTDREGETGQ
jgi:EF hand